MTVKDKGDYPSRTASVLKGDMEKKERSDKYWICHDCAEAKGWIGPSWAVTVIRGLCGHCDKQCEEFLTPIVDFKRGKVNPIWD